jgi:hypothetical protein
MELDRRNYLLSGEAAPEDWERAKLFLGGLDLHVQAIDPNILNGHLDTENGNGTVLPYHLHEITDAEQFVSQEHFHEFWPTYSERLQSAGQRAPDRRRIVDWAFLLITQLETPDRNVRRSQLAQRFQLDIAKRYDEGFGFADRPWRDYVIGAGSLIDFADSYTGVPHEQRITALNQDRFGFVVALANTLRRQIKPARRRRSI